MLLPITPGWLRYALLVSANDIVNFHQTILHVCLCVYTRNVFVLAIINVN